MGRKFRVLYSGFYIPEIQRTNWKGSHRFFFSLDTYQNGPRSQKRDSGPRLTHALMNLKGQPISRRHWPGTVT